MLRRLGRAALLLLAVIVFESLSQAAPIGTPQDKAAARDSADHEYRKGIEALKKGRLDDARARFDAALKLMPETVGPLLGLAEIALRRNQLPAAEPLLRRALAAGPEDPGTHTAWGRYLYALGRYDEAIAAFERAAALDKGASALVDLADLYMLAKGDAEKAVPLYQAAIAADRTHGGAQFGLGAALARLGRNKEALGAFEAAAILAPKDPQPRYHQGLLFSRAGDYSGALNAYDNTLRLDAKYLPAALGRAEMLRLLGRPEFAESAYREALQLAPQHAPTLVGLGMLYQSQSRLDEAARTWRSVLKVDPTNVIALNNLAYSLAERKESLDEALDAASRAKALAGDDPNVRGTLGWVHRARREFLLAAEQLEPLAKSDPTTVRLYQLGAVYADLGRYREAADLFERSLKLDPKNAPAREAFENVKRWR